ncbi:MAG TPA: TonB family protein [Rhizomicrobium sp.]|jgi:protein TonB
MALQRPYRAIAFRQRSNRFLSVIIVVLLHVFFIYIFASQIASVRSLTKGLNGARLGSVIEAAIYSAPMQKPQTITQVTKASQRVPITQMQSHEHDRSGLDRAPALTAPSQEASAGAAAPPASDPGAVVIAGPAGGATLDIASQFQRELLSHIEPFLHYPEEARATRPEGVVVVMFAMARNGVVLGAWVKQSSGSSVLDQEALTAIAKAQPMPQIPAELPAPLNIELPVTFSQKSSQQ